MENLNIYTSSLVLGLFGFLSYIQIKLLNKSSSDHLSHLFIIEETIKAGWKFPSYPTAIINKSSWGGYPILLHFIIGKFPKNLTKFLSNYIGFSISLINPIIILLLFGLLDNYLLLFLLLFSPFNFDVSNASNYGFSSRSLGQFLFTIFIALLILNPDYYLFSDSLLTIIYIFLLVFLIAFNVFAFQCLLIFSFVSIFFGFFLPLKLTLISLIFFSVTFGKYGRGYILSTVKYWNTYRKELAKKYILEAYPSFFITPFKELPGLLIKKDKKGLYNLFFKNGVLMSIFLNPIPWMSLFLIYEKDIGNTPFIIFTFSMFLAFCATSIRIGRFWGESNRYLETLTPFSLIFIFQDIFHYSYVLIIYFTLSVLGLLIISSYLSKRLKVINSEYEVFEEQIDKFAFEPIFFSNNHHVSKYFLTKDWKFILIWSIEENIAGINSAKVFSQFPKISFTHSLDIIDRYHPNLLLIEKYDDVALDQIQERGFTECFSHENIFLFTK